MANFNTFGDLSTAPNTNTTIAGSNLAEQCNMNVVNDGIRALAAMGKSLGTFITTTGTDTYVSTFAPVPDALATDFLYGVNIVNANTSTTPTWNPSGFGPKTITDTSGNALVAGALNGRHILIYDGTNFRVLNPAKFTPMSDATNGGVTVTAGTIALNVNDLTTKTTPDPTADFVAIYDAAGAATKKTLGEKLGRIAQVVNTETGAVATGSTTVPPDDTIPQNTEGDQYMTLSITPTNSGSTLVIDVVVNLMNTASVLMIVSLFQDTTASALASAMADIVAGSRVSMAFRHKMTAGTTSATTFKVRAGGSASGTTTFNGSGGSRLFGGALASSITITEILP